LFAICVPLLEADVAHFAELDDTNTVLRVIVVNNDDCP
jgi:hypothetical protein